MKGFLKSVILHRILVIFIVGFVSRSFVNNMFEVNVFKEYTDVVSLVYYSLMACFTSYVNSLPSISLNAFNYNIVRDAIIAFCNNMSLSNNKASIGTSVDSSNKVIGLGIDPLIHLHIRRPSAGVVGLYSQQDGGKGVDHITKHSIGDRFRCRLLWYSLIRYTEDYATYKEYKGSLESRVKVSIVDEFRRNREIRRNK